MRSISLFLFTLAVTLVVSASESAKFPLACGVYDIGGIAEMQVEKAAALDRSRTIIMTLAEKTLSKTQITLKWKTEDSKMLQGKFWVLAKVKLNQRITPYLLNGSVLEKPEKMKLLPANHSSLQSYVLLEEETSCDGQ